MMSGFPNHSLIVVFYMLVFSPKNSTGFVDIVPVNALKKQDDQFMLSGQV